MDLGLEMFQHAIGLSALASLTQRMDRLLSLLECLWDLEQPTLVIAVTSLKGRAQEPAREMEAGLELHQSVASSDVVD